MHSSRLLPFAVLVITGCSALPDVAHQPLFHNPFPQLHRVAVLPFYNQSAEPTVDQELVALAYYNELKAIPGFEVMPVGVARQLMLATGIEPHTGTDFQQLAAALGVDAVVVGSVTDYSPYYPPRLGIAVRWYAANPCFHPIPAGYGLPWGSAEEEFIPESLVFEAEFALAREQLATQTPQCDPPRLRVASQEASPPVHELPPPEVPHRDPTAVESMPAPSAVLTIPTPGDEPELPPDWPDPRGFIPPPPRTSLIPGTPQSEPVLSLTRLYHGNDAEFTSRLANYFYFRDEARFGGWQSYLQRSEDFIRFCCHLHITELLAARGGAGKTRVVWRWPIGRYDR
jgi:hypothetical protein